MNASKIRFQNILAIGAHPDDIEYGCFGWLLKQRKAGANVSAFVASLGSKGDPSSGAAREIESKSAFDTVPMNHTFFRKQNGLAHQDFDEILDLLFQFIQKVKPDLILTLGPHDTHQEHRILYDVTLAAARRSTASILAYSILSNTLQFSPTVFVDINDEFGPKCRALRLHESQSAKYYMSDEYLEIFHSQKYASLHGLRRCEAYEVVRLFI